MADNENLASTFVPQNIIIKMFLALKCENMNIISSTWILKKNIYSCTFTFM